MKSVKTFLKYVVGVVAVLSLGFIFVTYYSYIFADNVEGEIFKVERVTQPTMIIGSSANPKVNAASSVAMHSFAVAVKAQDGNIYTASSEDRQWAVAVPGCHVVAKFYPYPFWVLEKSGTYFNARLESMRDCPSGTPPETPTSNIPDIDTTQE
jgi:hypothetical protein